jgi:hypothetical protein
MKKYLLFTMIVWASCSAFAQNIDTIAAWTFPSGIDTLDIYPDVFIPDNKNKYISAEDTISWPNTTLRDIASTEGFTTFAGTAIGWDNGAGSKLWSIKIKAPGYSHLKVSSKHFSDIEFPGPKDWKVQARLSGEDWIDVEGGTFVCGNDWTTGVVSNIELPEVFNDPGTTSIYIRWIMTTNLNTAGSDVEAAGISKIDDVVITGELPSGTGDIRLDNQFRFYPNPVQSDKLNIYSSLELSGLNIYSLDGQLILTQETNGITSVKMNGFCPGIYFIEPVYSNNQKGLRKKLIVL